MVIDRFTMRAMSAFRRNRAGNVAMMWALMGTVLIGLVGLTVDFTRAQAIRNTMQNAADGAALVAERSSNLSMAARTDAARAYFDAEVGDTVSNVTFTVTELADGGHRVAASMPMPMSLASVISNNPWTIGVAAEAQANASPPIEVVMALDNTGSMSNDMGALRQGAQDLADTLLGLDGDTVSVGIVPFVAQVNIGTSNAAWVDTAGNNPYNGVMLEDATSGTARQRPETVAAYARARRIRRRRAVLSSMDQGRRQQRFGLHEHIALLCVLATEREHVVPLFEPAGVRAVGRVRRDASAALRH
ncbi:MAG: pilus assembly protein [Caulobacteraceae bacterium]|nr:pilus assembly protein [Caulobacteraceae bacterium]